MLSILSIRFVTTPAARVYTAGAVGYPGALPWGAVPGRREEAEAVARLRKPKELEKVVL